MVLFYWLLYFLCLASFVLMLAVIFLVLVNGYMNALEMISSREDAIKFFKKANDKIQFSKDELQASIELLQKVALEEGLSDDEINEVVKFLTVSKITAQLCMNIFNILIPITKISSINLEEILLWFFTEVGNERISNPLKKKCLQWLRGITYFKLADISVLESYYYSFIFLLNKPYLESSVCNLLYLISKPEDARRWVVQQILHISSNSNPKPHMNALLGLLKSYRSSVVPEKISFTSFHYKATPFDEMLRKAHDRKLKEDANISNSSDLSIEWNILNLHHDKSKKLTRLIPSATSIKTDDKYSGKKLQSIYDFKTIASLGVRPFLVECPAQTLSLLANLAGYHVLAFSDFAIKNRFFHKLYHTLCRVYLLELEPYSEKEKIFFLNSLKELQDYTQQSIPSVTTFLFHYLPIWDGDEYREQILSLLEWIEIREDKDLEKHIFPPLRQIFISSGTHCKCLIIEKMGKLMRNLLIMDRKEQNCFRSDFQNCNVIKCIEAIGDFVSGLICIGLIWNCEKTTRNILISALDFYEMTQAMEQVGDLPLIIIMPPALVYNCLFSNSRVCIARLCSLLVRFQLISIERLYLLGVFEDFAAEVQKLNIYTLDCYRCLWSKINFREDEDSFIFQHDIFCDKMWKLKEIYGGVIDKIFGIEYNVSFWDPKAKGLREVILRQLAEDYSSIVRLKQLTEERLLQVFSIQS